MNYNMEWTIKKISLPEQILEYLKEYDNYFIIPITDRVKDLQQYSIKLSRNAYTYIIEKNDITLGIIIFYANDQINQTAYLTMIAVNKEYEGKGIGSALLEKCLELSREVGMKKLKLEVDIDNSNAILFYQRKGFDFTEKATDRTVFMVKEI